MKLIELPDPDSIDAVADWLEISLLLESRSISKAAVASRIEGSSGVDPGEPFVDSVWRELSRRQGLYSQSPFAVGEHVAMCPEAYTPAPEYLACLLLSLYGVQGPSAPPTRLFERLVVEAVARYLAGDGLHLGWPAQSQCSPRTASDESLIRARIENVAVSLGERFCEAPPTRFKDRGVDAVSWLPFGDDRSGQVVILVQSAAGRDWPNHLPVPLDAWCQYIHWASNPIRAFAVPCIVSERDWHEASKDKGILFDRARIMRALGPGLAEPVLKKELSEWVSEQLAELGA